jgi:hypothetical protein
VDYVLRDVTKSLQIMGSKARLISGLMCDGLEPASGIVPDAISMKNVNRAYNETGVAEP